MSKQGAQKSLDAVRQAHENLKSMLTRAQELVQRDRINPAEIWACFTALATRIHIHFHAEEATGGLFDKLTAEAPQFAHRITELRREHDALRQTSSDLARETTTLTAFTGLPDGFVQAFSNLVTTLFRHEQKEDELLEDVYSSDQGAID